MEIQYVGLIGLYGGLLIGLLGWYFGRKKAKKERGVDEMYEHIMKTARSFSWFATIGAIYIFFTLYGIGFELHVPMVLGVIMLVQLGTWGISGAVMNFILSTGGEINYHIIAGVFIISVPMILFVIIAVITDNWIFLLWPIPFSLIGLYFIKESKSGDEGGN